MIPHEDLYDQQSMAGKGEEAPREPVVYCLVARDLPRRLLEQLRRHFRDEPHIELIVERRDEERRSSGERRTQATGPPHAERRRVRSLTGRRVDERRATLVRVDPPALPRGLRQHARRLLFVERLELAGRELEDRDTVGLIGRVQAGDHDAFAALYMRYFDRVYGYLRIALGDPGEAENAVQEVFAKILDALPRYQPGGTPFRAWLFVIVRNHTVSELRRRGRVELVAPDQLERRPLPSRPEPERTLGALDWVSNRDLLLFIERLPLAQRQALYLRYVLDLSHRQIAEIMERNPDDIRALLSRAHRFLRQRLVSVAARSETRSQMVFPRPQSFILRRRRFALMR